MIDAEIAKQCRSVICGSTPNVVSPIRPRDAVFNAPARTGQPRDTRSAWVSADSRRTFRTLDEHAIERRRERPDVPGKVGVIEPALEREEPRDDLPDLGRTADEQERAEAGRADGRDDHCELHEAVRLEACRGQRRPTRLACTSGVEAVPSQQEDAERRGDVDEDVLEVEQRGEQQGAERVVLCLGREQRKHQDTQQEAVVLRGLSVAKSRCSTWK